MTRVARIVPWLLVGTILGVLALATGSLVALEHRQPEALTVHEQVAFLYVHAIPLTFGVVAALIIRSRPDHPEGWLFALLALVIAVQQVLEVWTTWHPDNDALARLYATLSAPVIGLLALILLLFPDGRPPSPRWRPVVALVCLFMAVGILLGAAGSDVPWAGTSDSAALAVPLGLLLVGLLSLGVRWRTATGETRQQVKWLLVGASVFGIELTLGLTLTLLDAMSDDPDYVGNAIFVLTVCLIPTAMGIGIVRHHLYDVDRILSRTIAYGVLLIASAGVFVGSIALFAGLVTSRTGSPGVLALATTAITLIALRPLWPRLVAFADRRVYGTRTEPAQVMAAVAADLAAYRSPEDGMSGLAHAARQAARARGAVVRVALPDGTEHIATAADPSSAGARVAVPIRVDGTTVGSITVVDPSRHSEGMTLLSRLAALATPAAADMRTIAELRGLSARISRGNEELAASRARLANAEERERAHLMQTTQAEVLPALVDLRQRLPSREAIAAGIVRGAELEDAARHCRELAERIRSLAHDVLPPVLADRGLAAGLRAHVRRLGADVSLSIPESPRLTNPIESTLYECGRVLLDAATATAGPATLSLAVSVADVDFVATFPAHDGATHDGLDDALRLVADRLAVIGGALTRASSQRTEEVHCLVPLSGGAPVAGTPSIAARRS